MFNRRLFREARAQRLLLAASLLLSLLAAALVALQAWLMARVINAVFLNGQDLAAVWPSMLQLAAVILLRAAASGGAETSSRLIGVRIKGDLRQRLFEHLVARGPASLGAERSGELATTLVEGVEALQAYFGEYLPAMAQAALLPLTILAAIFPLDPLSGFVLLLTAPLIPYFMVLIGRLAEQRTQRQWQLLGRLGAHFLDVMQGLTTLKLFGRSRAQGRVIREVSRSYADATLDVLRVAFLSALALELLATLGTAIVAVEIGLRLLYSRILFQQALFILILAPEFYLPLRNLGARFHAGMSGVAAAGRIFEILDQPVHPAGDQPASRRWEQIALVNLGYRYPDSQTPIFEHATFLLRPGQLSVLVGPTGAGKSTLMQLLLGFLRPQQGLIEVDGRDLTEIDPKAWRAQLAWVPQRPYLFQASLAANLRLARPAASDAELWAALEQAQLAETVRAIPQQLATEIGERGARLSGGQAQRLALARAYLKDAPLLLMDEPTAHLDAATEAAVTAALDAWRQGKTALVIAHRPATIQRADQILLVQDGRVTPIKSYAELEKRPGFGALALEHSA